MRLVGARIDGYDPAMAVSVADRRARFVRLLHRGLDLPSYFDAADRALAGLVPFDASCWLSLDPATMLPTSHFSREYGFDQLLMLAANEFLEEDVNKFAELARAARPVVRGPSRTMRPVSSRASARPPPTGSDARSSLAR